MSQVQVNDNKIEEYIELLNEAIKESKISNWNINTISKRRNNVYVEKDYKIESTLKTERNEVLFHIFKDYTEEVGDSTFTLSEADTVEDFSKELDDAIFICSQSKSKKYTLPKKTDSFVSDSNINYDEFYDKQFVSDFDSGSLNVFIADKLRVFKALIEKHSNDEVKVKLNAFEFHNTVFENSLFTSADIKKSFVKTISYMEFVLTAIDSSSKETEHIVYEKISDLLGFDFEKFFENNILKVKDTSLAKNAESFKGEVILNGSACKDFFIPDLTMNAAIAHCSARFKFLGFSKYEKGVKIAESNLDKLTVYSNPLVKNNNASTPYDDDGVSAKRTCLIKDGVVENFFASKQYADYSEIEPTGPLGVIEVGCGTKSYGDLFSDDDVVEIVTFSSFVPDIVSGDFSAEIRLGYLSKDGKRVPFKGGLFSGNIFELLKYVELSSEQKEEVGYLGPKAVKFTKASIVGN